MSHNWPPETIMSGKFLAQKILFDHPSVYVWATNSLARFYTIIHLRPLVGMHSLVIEAEELIADAIFAAKQNLPTNNLSVHGLALILAVHCLTFASMHANHDPPGVPIQQLNVAYGFSPLLHFEVDSKSKEKSKGQIKWWE